MAVLSNTPFTGRRNSQSVLDFMYWAMKQVNSTQLTGRAPTRDDDDRVLSSSLVEYAASQVGVGLPSGVANVRGFCTDQNTLVEPDVALKVRGALLFVDNAVLVCMGDGERVIDVQGGQHFVRYIENAEKFDIGARVPHVRYQ